MPGFHKRREYKYEGTVESIYLMDDMTVEVVADGIHVPPTILRLVYKIKGVERMCHNRRPGMRCQRQQRGL